MAEFIFTRAGRRPATFAGFALTWAFLAAIYLFLQASGWIVAFLGLFTLPALYDLLRNPVARLSLSDQTLAWSSGRQSVQLPLARVAKMRFDTRLDFSVRVSAVLHDGTKIRLPYDCLPPHKVLEGELTRRCVATERHHFQLLS